MILFSFFNNNINNNNNNIFIMVTDVVQWNISYDVSHVVNCKI